VVQREKGKLGVCSYLQVIVKEENDELEEVLCSAGCAVADYHSITVCGSAERSKGCSE
jgi:hypothetical protein